MSAVRPHMFYRPRVLGAEGASVDPLSILAVVLGTACMFFESKELAWASVFASFSSIMNLRAVDRDLKQILSSLAFATMALFMRYFGPSKTIL